MSDIPRRAVPYTNVSDAARARTVETLREAADKLERGGTVVSGGMYLQLLPDDQLLIQSDIVIRSGK